MLRVFISYMFLCKCNLRYASSSHPLEYSGKWGWWREQREWRYVRRSIRSVNGQSAEQRARPVGQSPARIESVSVPAGSLSLPSVEPRRVCNNLLETAAQPRPDLKGYGQLASHGQVCTRERKEGQRQAAKAGGDERASCDRGQV